MNKPRSNVRMKESALNKLFCPTSFGLTKFWPYNTKPLHFVNYFLRICKSTVDGTNPLKLYNNFIAHEVKFVSGDDSVSFVDNEPNQLKFDLGRP